MVEAKRGEQEEDGCTQKRLQDQTYHQLPPVSLLWLSRLAAPKKVQSDILEGTYFFSEFKEGYVAEMARHILVKQQAWQVTTQPLDPRPQL